MLSYVHACHYVYSDCTLSSVQHDNRVRVSQQDSVIILSWPKPYCSLQSEERGRGNRHVQYTTEQTSRIKVSLVWNRTQLISASHEH